MTGHIMFLTEQPVPKSGVPAYADVKPQQVVKQVVSPPDVKQTAGGDQQVSASKR